jgi:hypothetical protein
MPHGRQDQRPGWFDPADDLDHQIDIVPADKGFGVGREQLWVDARAIPLGLPHSDADQLQRSSDSGAEIGCLSDDQPRHLRADNATAEQSYSKRCQW